MARRTRTGDPEHLREKLVELLRDFEQRLDDSDLREQVRALVPAVHLLRDLGSSLIPDETASSAQDRILHYIQRHPRTVVAGDELAVVSGISEYARRVRELRVEYGWPIYSGATAKEIVEDEVAEGQLHLFGSEIPPDSILAMNTDDYILVGEQDRDAAHRWNLANDIRREDISVRDRLLKYLRANVGKPVTGEELRYVARKAQSWPRRVRELRTEYGWPIATRNTGRPDLDVGVYVLEDDRQLEPHDRRIPDPVRVAVLERDDFSCQCCGWRQSSHREGDPRALVELHHIQHHIRRGGNEPENLVTLCNVHHDEVHRRKIISGPDFFDWLKNSC